MELNKLYYFAVNYAKKYLVPWTNKQPLDANLITVNFSKLSKTEHVHSLQDRNSLKTLHVN